MKKKSTLIFFLIIVLFLSTRLYQIAQNPPSLYWDEASLLYNAYSIGLNGKDEWGEVLPVHFRAFSEFKLPVYIYTAAVFTKLFGLSELSIRLPAVLFSLGTLIVTYFLVLKITKLKEVGLLTVFTLSIIPWFFIFSRVGFEASAGLFFYTLGILMLLINKHKRLILILSAVAFVFSVYSYNSFRLIAIPTFFIVLGYQFFLQYGFNGRSMFAQLKKYLVTICIVLVIFAISLIPVIRLFLFDTGFNRIQGLSLFPVVRVDTGGGQPRLEVIPPNGGWESMGENYLTFLHNYLSYFSPYFLLLKGDSNMRHHLPGFGQIYFPDIFFLIIGVIYALKKKGLYILPLLILLVTVLPAALGKESAHALRSFPMVPFLSIFIGTGIAAVSNRFKYSLIIIIGLYLLLFSNYFMSFLMEYPKKSSQEWQFGYKQIFTSYKDQFKNYDNVVVSNQYAQPYILGLVYLKINPEEFRKNVEYSNVNDWGFSTVQRFDKIYFMKVTDANLPSGKNLLFSLPTDQIDEDASNKDTIYFLDGEPAFFVYEYEK